MAMMRYAKMRPAALHEVRPAGWLMETLQRQADGLTGHPGAAGEPYGVKFWGAHGASTAGAYDVWWPYEQTAYWIDGALKCGRLAQRPEVYAAALEELDYAVQHPDADGFIGPPMLRDKDRWPHTVFFRAVLAQYQISGEAAYLQALRRHYAALPHPMDGLRDVTGVEILVNLYEQSGEAAYLELAEDLYARFNARFPENDCSLEMMRSERVNSEHGVSFNEIAKLGAILYMADGNEEYLSATLHAYDKIARDQLLASGLHSCSEHLRGKDPLDSHEMCDVTDHTWSLSYLLEATGAARYADQIEAVIFNALPGAVTKDFKRLQYLSCPNQIAADAFSNHNRFMRGANWMQFRPDHEVQCCPGNLHRAVPNYIANQWQRSPEGGIIAALYGPGRLETTAGPNHTPVTITAHTRYPFEEAIEFEIAPQAAARFTFSVRIPGWCRRAELSVNGQPVEASLAPATFVPLAREWQPGDRVTLRLPFELRLEPWPLKMTTSNDLERAVRLEAPLDGPHAIERQTALNAAGAPAIFPARSVHYGPLTLSLPVTARLEIEQANSTDQQRRKVYGEMAEPKPYTPLPGFDAWNLAPASDWNYALAVDEASLPRLAEVRWREPQGYPFEPESNPLSVRLPARRVRNWQAIQVERIMRYTHWMTPTGPERGDFPAEGRFTFTPPLPEALQLAEAETIELVPYGSTLLRITVFPHSPETL